MKKSNITVNNAEVIAPVEVAVSLPSFEETLALVPAKEHRSFDVNDFNAVADKAFPATVDECLELVRALNAKQLFALATRSGRAECVKVAKLFIESDRKLLPSAIAGFKSVVGGKTAYSAGALTYSLLSAVKNS